MGSKPFPLSFDGKKREEKREILFFDFCDWFNSKNFVKGDFGEFSEFPIYKFGNFQKLRIMETFV